jgi:hypothetical protein
MKIMAIINNNNENNNGDNIEIINENGVMA